MKSLLDRAFDAVDGAFDAAVGREQPPRVVKHKRIGRTRSVHLRLHVQTYKRLASEAARQKISVPDLIRKIVDGFDQTTRKEKDK